MTNNIQENFKIMSYNVHGLGNRNMPPDIFEYLKQFEIISLLETHCDEERIEKYQAEFRSFHLYWKPAFHVYRYGRGIAGYIFGVRKDLRAAGVEHTFSNMDGVDVIELKTATMRFSIIPIYIRKANWDKEFELIRKVFLKFNIINPIVIGDINGRFGEIQQKVDDCYKTHSVAILEKRVSKDRQKIEWEGGEFMKFCDKYNLIVLNGRTHGDTEGNITYASGRHKSVIDTCAVSQKLLAFVKKFSVLNREGSDHFPIQLELNLSHAHYLELSTEQKSEVNLKNLKREDVKNSLQNIPSTKLPVYIEDLDKPITVDEVRSIKQKLKLYRVETSCKVLINASKDSLNKIVKVYNLILNGSNTEAVFDSSVEFDLFKSKCLEEIIIDRLTNWNQKQKQPNKHKAVFQEQYSTLDNIYNLMSIVHLKFAEGMKVYAFFVIFDKVPRKRLMDKLLQMGVTPKFLSLLARIYRNENSIDLKQSNILWSLLLSFYLNDLYDRLGGGLQINQLNIRLSINADGVVLLADDPWTLKRMIKELELYCSSRCIKVDLNRSAIMVFRKGGKLSWQEEWFYNGEKIAIVSDLKYFGIMLTSRATFRKHITDKNSKIKDNLEKFFQQHEHTVISKWKYFVANCKELFTYGAQLWGFSHFDEVAKLQRFLLKLILNFNKLASNDVIALETGFENFYIYTLRKHLRYISNTLYKYDNNSLSHKLSVLIITQKLFWYQELQKYGFSIISKDNGIQLTQVQWNKKCENLLQNV